MQIPVTHAGDAGRRLGLFRPGSRAAVHDPRWPAVADALAMLQDYGRYSVRIVDADCGAGCLLLQALRHARALGFTAIEGRGIAASPALIGRANAAADRLRDPAIGVAFEVADPVAALAAEQEMPADIVIGHAMHGALRRAGRVVIADGPTVLRRAAP